MDETHIDETAQQVLKITENTIKNMEKAVKNAFKEIAGCARVPRVVHGLRLT